MIALVDQPFKCVHCGKGFMKEGTMLSHMCEKKRRAMQKDEKRVQTGFYVFNRFWEITQGALVKKTYEEFCKSAYYSAFVKFGSFVNNVNPLYPSKFIDFVIKSNVKIDHWCKDTLYDKYLYDMIKVEPVDSAIERSLKTMADWGEKNSAPLHEYFINVNINRFVDDIKNGKVSPWVVLSTKSGKAMISALTDDQLSIIAPAFDFPFWIRNLKQRPADVELVKEVCSEVNIK